MAGVLVVRQPNAMISAFPNDITGVCSCASQSGVGVDITGIRRRQYLCFGNENAAAKSSIMGWHPRLSAEFKGVASICSGGRRSCLVSANTAHDWDDNWNSSAGQSLHDLRKKMRSALSTLLDSEEPDVSLPEYAEDLYEDGTPKAHPYAHLKVGERWEEIQGANDWHGLLDPMDAVLRSELTRYGEFAHAAYDAFDFDEFSHFRGSCKFRRENFFQRLDLENRGYEVTSYIYSTSVVNLPKFFKRPKTEKESHWSKDSNWMGYVAVCTSPEEIERLGRRDILVAWRGTVTSLEWIENMKTMQCPTGEDPFRSGSGSISEGLFGWASKELKVEQGFLSVYESENKHSRYNKKSARKQVWAALAKLMNKYKDENLSITVVGHSLGASLATLCAYDIAESGLNVCPIGSGSVPNEKPQTHTGNGEAQALEGSHDIGAAEVEELRRVPVTVFTFGGPRLGNSAFRDRLAELNVKVLRVVNVHDLVTRVPGLLFNENTKLLHFKLPDLKILWLVKLLENLFDSLPGTYSHVGTELRVNNLHSPFLRPSKQPVDAHNLECYLHLVDGYVGKSLGYFCDKVCQRDVALVNKQSNLLDPKFRIPPLWFQEENKGLVRDRSGRFSPRGRDHEDHPQRQ